MLPRLLRSTVTGITSEGAYLFSIKASLFALERNVSVWLGSKGIISVWPIIQCLLLLHFWCLVKRF